MLLLIGPDYLLLLYLVHILQQLVLLSLMPSTFPDPTFLVVRDISPFDYDMHVAYSVLYCTQGSQRLTSHGYLGLRNVPEHRYQPSKVVIVT
jgi:hypothetical protein